MNQYVEVDGKTYDNKCIFEATKKCKNLATLKITKNESCTG